MFEKSHPKQQKYGEIFEKFAKSYLSFHLQTQKSLMGGRTDGRTFKIICRVDSLLKNRTNYTLYDP